MGQGPTLRIKDAWCYALFSGLLSNYHLPHRRKERKEKTWFFIEKTFAFFAPLRRKILIFNSGSEPLDRLPGTAGAQGFHWAASGNVQTGRNLGQRIQHEGAFVQPRVRQG